MRTVEVWSPARHQKRKVRLSTRLDDDDPAIIDGSPVPQLSYGLQSRVREFETTRSRTAECPCGGSRRKPRSNISSTTSPGGRGGQCGAQGARVRVTTGVNGAPASQSRLGARLHSTVRGPGQVCLLSISLSRGRQHRSTFDREISHPRLAPPLAARHLQRRPRPSERL